MALREKDLRHTNRSTQQHVGEDFSALAKPGSTDGGWERTLAVAVVCRRSGPRQRRSSGTTQMRRSLGFPARLALVIGISTDRARLDIDLIHRFLCEESYWAIGRPREVTELAIAGSLCFGAYDDRGQVGFARVVTDRAPFGFLADVFMVPRAHGTGVGKALMAAFTAHPEVRDLERLTLATNDAHGLYSQYGSKPLDDPERCMVRREVRP